MSTSGRRWLFLLLLCPLILIGCWSAPFLACDDPDYLLMNSVLQHGTPWSAIFKPHSGTLPDYYVPLLYIIFRVERCVFEPLLGSLAGPNAWACGVRTVSLLGHAGACVLIWKLLRRLNAGTLLAAFVMAAVAFHPVVCHSVCWCYEGKTVYSAILGFAAVFLYMTARTPWQTVLSAFVYGLSLLTFPRAMGVITVVASWELLKRPSIPATNSEPEPRRWNFVPLAPWILLTVADIWISLKLTNVSQVAMPPIGGSIWTAALTDVPVLQRYIFNLLCPFNLAADYGIAAILSVLDLRLWLGILCLALFVGFTFAIAERQTRRMVLFGWLWFLGAMLPTLNFVGRHNLMSDNYVYFSLPGFFLVVGLALRGAMQRLSQQVEFLQSQRRNCATALICVTVVLFGFLSARRSTLYTDAFDLYQDAVTQEPECALNRLIFARLVRHRLDEQLAAGKAAAATNSADLEMSELQAGISGLNFYRTTLITDSFIWLGRSYYEHGCYDDAIEQFKKARSSPQGIDDSRTAIITHYLGLILVEQKKFDLALQFFEKALPFLPPQSSYKIERGGALLKLKAAFAAAGDSVNSSRCGQDAIKALRSVEPNDERYAEAQRILQTVEEKP